MTNRLLPAKGIAWVSTDLHGSWEDFERMRVVWEQDFASSANTHWVILGDLVHAPNDEARRRRPELYDYDDASADIVESVNDLTTRYPDRVHLVLGNHDWAHIGGPRTRKFHADESEFLERKMSEDAVQRMHALFERACLLVTTPCGAALSHGSPGIALESWDDLDLRSATNSESATHSVLTSYGQPEAASRRFLESISRLGPTQRFVVHGHDRDEAGWYVEEETQLCPVIFGAPRSERRVVRLDLEAEYASLAAALEKGVLVRLWSGLEKGVSSS